MCHPDPIIYKLLTQTQWQEFKSDGMFKGAPIDLKDGYIHFSTAEQCRETASKHFAGQVGLKLASVSTQEMGSELVYEVSRGGALFPHLYGELPVSAIIEIFELEIGPDGEHIFPENF